MLKKNFLNGFLLFYIFSKGVEFVIYDYYILHKVVGIGAYGIVCSGLDKRNNQPIAIKKVF